MLCYDSLIVLILVENKFLSAFFASFLPFQSEKHVLRKEKTCNNYLF